MSGRGDLPVRVTVPGEKRPLALVPSSILQASRLAAEYADSRPDTPLIIKRGEKVLQQVEPRTADAA